MRRALPALVCASLVAGNARAADEATGDDPTRWLKELELEAGSAEADLRLRELDLRDGVKVTLLPYFLRAQRIHLSLSQWGVRVRGQGLLTFCPCESPPVSIGFSGGWAGPPDELIVEDPTLRIFGVPVFWLPYLWLRSPRKIGLTTPDVSFRGPDGLFLGQGVHAPIGKGLELGAGFYTRGGYALTADLATERTQTLVRFDFRRGRDVGETSVPSGAGLSIDARGDLGDRPISMVWDVDAVRGARGLRTTLDLEPLARPFDRASAVARVGPLALGADFVDARLAPLDQVSLARPWAGLFAAAAMGELGGMNGSIVAGPRWARGRGAETIADASLALDLGGPLGLATWTSSARVDGRLARGGGDDPNVPASGTRAHALVSEAKIEVSLPFARPLAFESARGGPPVLHVVEPLLRGTALSAWFGGERAALAGFTAAPAIASPDFGARTPSEAVMLETSSARTAFLATTGVRSALGALFGGIAPGTDPFLGKLRAELVGGALVLGDRRFGAVAGDVSFVTRNAAGGATRVALQGATARPLTAPGAWASIVAGHARWEASRGGFGAELRGAVRGDLPVLAGAALLGSELAPRLTTATGLFAPGATVGVGTGFPIGFGLRLGGDVDVFAPSLRALSDRSSARLLEVRGTLRYRHPCGCFRLAIRGGRVVGREGIDLFATFELARTDPNDPRDF